ncbi:S8 family peptidase [Micromonospora sp. NPDC005305]|uniref:S8 family peptidase n=1 Tax=Micromonospora sp. NPDC005305 TaxID=3156875 RepID=UPI00339ED557
MVTSLRRLLALVVSAALVAAAPAPAGADPSTTTTTTTVAGPPAAVHQVTLVTGDVVELSTFTDGRQVATVDDTAGPERLGYHISEQDGDVYVVPVEALPYVSSGRIDRALFDITDLVADGYHDAARDDLPLLVTGTPARAGARAAVPAVPAGVTRRRDLPGVGAVAVTERKAGARAFWDAVTGGHPGATGPRTLAGGVGRIWLDRRVHADLTDSVPQIGAPVAWRSGYDGQGVKVAVLDTGYDPHHPDLKGKVVRAANFTPESGLTDVTDRFGHGTHVAATIAGRGRAGRPSGKGVAPGASLLVGKVLDQNGSGELSWVMAGMEWAVGQGARVVNVSIGAPASEGPDPITEAVDALTARTGALFVVSAGNSGPGVQTITTPGTAASALTVGAVSKQDEIPSFSSRGPRLGDGVVKPEITAPGVGIVAARAAGTSLGEVVDASYTSMSGTSMAAPHVAGAAALLAQKHPDWRADRLKATLVSSATDPRDAPVWEQGAGRVDVPTALAQQVSVASATVALGKVSSDASTQRATVGYRNDGDNPVTLTLAAGARVAGADDRRAALSISPRTLTVPAHGRAEAAVTLDPGRTHPGGYAGLITARAAGHELRTPVGFAVVPPVHTLTIEAFDRDGKAAHGFSSRAEVWNLDTGETSFAFFSEGTARVELPAGRYHVMTDVLSLDAGGWPKDVSQFGEPELTLDRDRALRYDARTATEVRVDTPEPTVTSRFALSWQRTTATRSRLSGSSYNQATVRRVYAAPTRPVTTGTFQYFVRWDLTAPPLTAEVSGGMTLTEPRLLDGAQALDGRLTTRLVDGGAGTSSELAGARDAAVLLRYSTAEAVPGQLAAAREAGAKIVLLAPEEPGLHYADAVGASVPAYWIQPADADRLRERLAAGGVTIALHGRPYTPYRYDLLLVEPAGIPRDLHYTARDLRLATVDTEFHQYRADMVATESRAGFPDGVTTAFAFSRAVGGAGRRTEHVSTQAVTWQGSAVVESVAPGQSVGAMWGPQRRLRPGDRVREVWFPALLRPAVPRTLPNYAYGAPPNRFHDAIRVGIPQYADGDGNQYGWVDGRYQRAELVLRRGDAVLGRSTRSSEQFTVPHRPGWYRLSLDVTGLPGAAVLRDTSTATHTAWTFRSAAPKDDHPVVLPLIQLAYDIDTDLTNTVRADRAYPLLVRPGYQPGAEGPGRFDLAVQVSYDDGAHWRAAPLRGAAASVPPAPAGAGFASVRVTARDRAGNRIEQTVIRAWKVRG